MTDEEIPGKVNTKWEQWGGLVEPSRPRSGSSA